MTGPFKSDPVDAVQRELFPGNVFDLLPTEHDCYLFHDLFSSSIRAVLNRSIAPWANAPIIRRNTLAF